MGTKVSSGCPAESGALKEVWTTVTASPRARRSSASWSIGAMWLGNGKGNITTRRGGWLRPWTAARWRWRGKRKEQVERVKRHREMLATLYNNTDNTSLIAYFIYALVSQANLYLLK
uniref:Uncharacterized protein n=1 Tax=Oryza brachyantha TaxID=4533 RepID=J3MJP7_ORYBR